jgi:transposase
VRALNRIEVVSETLRHALNSLAVVAPEWLRAVSPSAWRNRYARRAEDDRLPITQASPTALTVGAREHQASYLRTVQIAAHAWCECRERHT